MANPAFWNLSAVSDEHLLQDLNSLLAGGARMEARIVAHLAEVEERRLHLKAATSSLFDYCRRRMRLSESEAFHRITAARLARRFPAIFELLDARAIHLSALRVLRDHLTNENHRELLALASGKSTKEVEVLVATLTPRPDVASRIRKLPAPRRRALESPGVAPTGAFPVTAESATVIPVIATPVAAITTIVPEPTLPPPRSGSPSSPSSPSSPFRGTCEGPARPVRRSDGRVLEPLSATRYLLRMSISLDQKEKLERARDLLSHANPSGELAVVLERALDLLLKELEKQRFAQLQRRRPVRKGELHANSQPRSGEPQRQADRARGQSKDLLNEVSSSTEAGAPALREGLATRNASAIQRALHAPQLQTRQRARREHISNEVLRAVARRDDFQCTYVDGEGRRCPGRAFLQVHHEQAYALGGPSTFENLRLLCGAHNRLLAEQDFGRAHQERFTRRKPSGVPLQPAQAIEGETVSSRTTSP